MSETKEKTKVDRIKDYVPFFTTMLMIAGIAFTYYTYIYDINKTPQLVIEKNITKVDETDRYYIIKISIRIKNQSKSKVEILGNQCKIFASRCRLIDNNASLTDKEFMRKTLFSSDSLETLKDFSNLEMNKYMECSEKQLIGFFQPMHNDSWLLPEETINCEMTSAVPKTFDMVNLDSKLDYSLSEENIVTKYKEDKNGRINYQLYVIEGNDSSKIHELSYSDERDKSIIKKNSIILSAFTSDFWLSGNNAVKNSNKTFKKGQTTDSTYF